MRTFIACAVLALSLGCNKKPIEPPPPPPALKVVVDPTPSMPDGHPALTSLAVSSRGPRRISVPQLEQSLDQIAGLPLGSVKLPPDIALTLGRPDFKRLTEEQLEPTPLFMKFMVDLGAFYCGSLAMGEAGRAANDKLFTKFPTVDENLRFLLLRFTGIEGADADPYVTRLNAAYLEGSQGAGDLPGYQAVCISLFNSPEFLLY